MYELRPIYDSRKSFYKKAMVQVNYLDDCTKVTLYSYMTKVAEVIIPHNTDHKQFVIYGFYSATTLRHIKEFYRQEYTNISISKKELEVYCL